jgi:hypothetical protein
MSDTRSTPGGDAVLSGSARSWQGWLPFVGLTTGVLAYAHDCANPGLAGIPYGLDAGAELSYEDPIRATAWELSVSECAEVRLRTSPFGAHFAYAEEQIR